MSTNNSSTCADAARVSSSCASFTPRERYTASVSSIVSFAKEMSNGFSPKMRNIIPAAAAFPAREASPPPTSARMGSAPRRKSAPSTSPVGANESTKNAPVTGVANSIVRRSDAAAASMPQRSPSRTVTRAIKTGQSSPIIIVSMGRWIAASA